MMYEACMAGWLCLILDWCRSKVLFGEQQAAIEEAPNYAMDPVLAHGADDQGALPPP